MNDYKSKLRQNISLYYVAEILGHMIFFIPIWDMFESKFLAVAYMSAIASLRFLIAFLLEIPSGVFADLIGRKYSVATGFFSEAFGLFLIALFPSAGSIFVAAFFRGAGDALRSGSDTAIVYDSLKDVGEEKRFSEVMANLKAFWIQMSLMFSTVAGGYLFKIWIGLPYFLYGCLITVSGILYLFMQEPNLDSEKFSFSNYVTQTKMGVKETFKNPMIRKLSIFYGLSGGVTWSTQIYLNQIFATSIGYSPTEKSWLFGIVRFVNSILLIKILKVHKVFSGKKAFIFYPVLIFISTVPAIFENQSISTAIIFSLTFASTLRFVVLDKLVNDELESKYRATAQSALNLYISFLYIIIVGLSGVFIQNFGVNVLYFLLGILSILTLLPIGFTISKTVRV